MSNIPFPNPHDIDALNDYLDARAAGAPVEPENAVEQAAQEFHILASRSDVRAPMQPRHSVKGTTPMTTTIASAPISNRTRRQMEAEKTRKSNNWLSLAIVAGLAISMIGSVWLNREPGDDNNQLAWAPGTVEVLSDETHWTQPISASECPDDATSIYQQASENRENTLYTQADYDQVSVERSYEIVGSANPEDATAVMVRMRASYGCIDVAKSFPMVTARWEYENRTTVGRTSLESMSGERNAATATISSWLANDLGLTPTDMFVNQNPNELTLEGTESLITRGLFDPAHAVEFADGRIGIIPSVVSYSGFPVEINDTSVPGFAPNMSIFVYQDGEWMLDENLPICLGDCSATPIASPFSIDGDVPGKVNPWATPDD